MKPTYEELEAKIQRQEDLFRRALEEIARLHEKIAKLEDQLKRNSKNSSKPPSTDQKGNTPDKEKQSPRASRMGKARSSFPPERVDKHVQCAQDAIECFYSRVLPPLISEAMGF